MKKIIIPLILALSAGISLLFLKGGNPIKVDESIKFAEPGMVAYAASYSTDPTNEPIYSTQNTKTFQYLNLGNTLDSYRGDSVKVGIIDSGINYDHEDFMVSGSTKVKGDSKYYAYQSSSWVYYKASQHGYSYIDDSLGHGTNVAATVAAAINSVGGTGLAPNVELYVYKVTNSSNGYEFGAIQNALMDAKTLGLDVINMSFQSYEHAVSYGAASMAASSGCSTILSYYLNQAYDAGITLVGAAGNYNTDEPSYPGSNNHVINVGSLNQTATDKAGFSNYGSTIDLVAPGYVYVADEASNTAYTNTQGTSFSAPLVTAAIALYIQQNPDATPAEIESALYASCDPIDDSGSAYTNWAGNGALNVAKFLGINDDGPTDIVINNPEIVDEELELSVGEYLDLDYTVNGVGTFDDSVNFYTLSGEDNVVSVNSSGRITAVGEGSDYVIIESNADSNVYTQVYVTVTSSGAVPTVTSVTVSPSSLNLDLNGTKTGNLTATVNGDNDLSQDVTWTSSNTSVATVSSTGAVTAKAIGSATITATSLVDPTKSGICEVSVTSTASQTLTIARSSFSDAGGYSWYDWSQTTSDSTTISGKAELYTTTTTSMQFNKSKGNKVAAIFNTVAIPGSITKIEASSSQTTIRSWTAYVTSTACSASGSTLTFGSNKTTVGTVSPAVGTSTSFGTSSAGYSYFCLQENDSSASYLSEIKITYTPKLLSSIAVKTAPTKTTYEAGETFNPTGLVITKTFSDSTTQDVTYSNETVSQFTFVPSTSTALTTSDTSVSITVGGKSCSQPISVSAAKTLSSISISGYTTSFVEGDTFSFGGTVTANWSDSTTSNVTGSSTFTGYNMTNVGNQTVTVSYTYKGTTKTASYSITVSAGTLSSIAVSGMTTEYVKNNPFSFDGVCTATFVNGYQKAVTPTNVTSPDMTTSGNQTIIVSYTYNGKIVTTDYTITINAYREVIEETTTSIYCTYDFSSISGTAEITNTSTLQNCYSSTGGLTGVSVTSRAKTYASDGFVRLATGSASGSIAFSFGTTNITSVSIVAKGWSDSEANCRLSITNGGSITTTSASSVGTYTANISPATNAITLSASSNNRIKIQSVTFYNTTTTPEDIGHSDDCVGLETFIDNYMHMNYTENLGYCKDNEHHYYTTAKAAFNALNTHQRSLFTTNSAYLTEWTRLSTWALFNGDSLNGSNILALSSKASPINNIIDIDNSLAIIVIISVISLSTIGVYFYYKKKKEN